MGGTTRVEEVAAGEFITEGTQDQEGRFCPAGSRNGSTWNMEPPIAQAIIIPVEHRCSTNAHEMLGLGGSSGPTERGVRGAARSLRRAAKRANESAPASTALRSSRREPGSQARGPGKPSTSGSTSSTAVPAVIVRINTKAIKMAGIDQPHAARIAPG